MKVIAVNILSKDVILRLFNINANTAGSFIMSCCDPFIEADQEVTGVCPRCERDVNKDGQTVEENCGYSPIECEECGAQPCTLAC